MLVTYEPNQLADILKEMASYVENLDNPYEKLYYFKEIIQSGLFHDAIGKMVEEKESEVTVTTEY